MPISWDEAKRLYATDAVFKQCVNALESCASEKGWTRDQVRCIGELAALNMARRSQGLKESTP